MKKGINTEKKMSCLEYKGGVFMASLERDRLVETCKNVFGEGGIVPGSIGKGSYHEENLNWGSLYVPYLCTISHYG